MSPSNETRKPTGRPSLLTAEQQNALEKHQPAPAATVPTAAAAPRRKHVWLVAGLSVMAIAAAVAVVQFGEPEAPSVTLAAAPAPAPAPAPANAAESAPVAATAAPAEASPLAQAESPPAASAATTPAVAAIVDEVPPPAEAKPKESLAQMLESGVPPAAKPAPAKAVRKPASTKPAKPSEKAQAVAAVEPDTDVELLAALVAHAKFDTSANARLSLPKALEQCKKQGKQDAARCRIRVCEGRWKKNECRVYSRSKLEKAASGS